MRNTLRTRIVSGMTLVGKGVGLALLFAALAGPVWAAPRIVPELDPSVAGSAVALASGAMLIIASRRRAKSMTPDK